MIDVFEQAMQRNGQAARNRARAVAALCRWHGVGALDRGSRVRR
jgi:hypothetical protein